MKYKLKIPGYYIIFEIIVSVIMAAAVYKLLTTAGDDMMLFLFLPVFLGTAYFVIISPLNTGIVINDSVLELKAPPYANKKIDYKEITECTIINIKNLTEEKPVFKIYGTALGKYKTGWFSMKNKRQVLLMINSDNVLKIAAGDRLFFISPEKLEEVYALISDKIDN